MGDLPHPNVSWLKKKSLNFTYLSQKICYCFLQVEFKQTRMTEPGYWQDTPAITSVSNFCELKVLYNCATHCTYFGQILSYHKQGDANCVNYPVSLRPAEPKGLLEVSVVFGLALVSCGGAEAVTVNASRAKATAVSLEQPLVKPNILLPDTAHLNTASFPSSFWEI